VIKDPEMTDYKPRLFADDAAVVHVGEGLLARTLPRAEWTHEAHLAACTWVVRERPDIAAEEDLPDIISTYNISVGGVNDDTQGYHDTITQFYVAAVRTHLSGRDLREPISNAVNALLTSPLGRRDVPLHFYSHERLFSVAARRKFVAPDLLPLSEMATIC
jgi:hypothetical protein